MNITQPPELLDRLAASYALGTLRGGARRRFEALAREQATVRAAALVWQTRWSGLTELQPKAQATPAVWTRIDNLVQADKAERAMQAARATPSLLEAPGDWWHNLLVWRGAAVAGALATLVAVVVGVQVNGGLRSTAGAQIAALQQELQAAPQIQYVAVLADDKATASMLVTFDPKNKQLVLQRVGAFRRGRTNHCSCGHCRPQGLRDHSVCWGRTSCSSWPRASLMCSRCRRSPSVWSPRAACPAKPGPRGRCCSRGR